MQTSFHGKGLDVLRAPDGSGQSSEARHYSASEESLRALIARTTPKDITNPFTSSHASCANAFIATAISNEHRFSEMHLHLPLMTKERVIVETHIAQPVMAAKPEIAPIPFEQRVQPTAIDDAASHLNYQVLEWDLSMPLLPNWEFESNLQLDTVAVNNPASPGEQAVIEPQPVNKAATLPADLIDVTIAHDYLDENGNVKFSGDAPAGSLLQFYIDDVLVGSQETDNHGHWQFEVPTDLSGAQHTFSAIPINAQGVIGSKTELIFITQPKPSLILLPEDESEQIMIDLALIEWVAPQEEITLSLLPHELTDKMLDGWQTQDGISVTPLMEYNHALHLDELAYANMAWH